MRRPGRSGSGRYSLAFAAALLLHAAMFASFPSGSFSPASLAADKGDAWVELEFVRPAPRPAPEPEPAVKPPSPLRRLRPLPPPRLPSAPPPPRLDPEALLPSPVRRPSPRPSVSPGDMPRTVSTKSREQAADRPTPPRSTPASAPPVPDLSGVRRARILGSSKPEYPIACQLGLHRPDGKPCEGSAEFLIEVLPDGRIGEIRLISSAGCKHLDDAVRKWLRSGARAQPATENGVPVRSLQRCVVEFRMSSEDR